MINKCEIRERILNFFKTKKLCKQAYTAAFYKSDPEVYEWLLHYFDGVPSLEHTSLAQKLWHIDHQINEALPYKFVNYKYGYKGGPRKQRRFTCFKDCLNEFKQKSLNYTINKTNIISIKQCRDVIYDAVCIHTMQYQKFIDDDIVFNSILYHTQHITDVYYKLLYIIYENDIYCPICGSYKTFKNLFSIFLKSTCDSPKCRHIHASNIAKQKDMSHLRTPEITKKRFASRAGYKHSEYTKFKISETNKKTWTPEKKAALIQKNFKTGVYERQSQTMKQLILDGKFTPKSENRLTHKTLYSNKTKIKYRSSWELKFHEMHIDKPLEYETLRIPYVYENVNHVYVIDFVDHINKQVYEIKPEAYCKIEPNITKIAAGKQWCKENNYTYNLITEKELCL